MIYAIEAIGSGCVKFGVAKDVAVRLYAHQVSCPLKLVILATAPWPNSAENSIHNLLRQQCVRGEWFKHEGLSIKVIDAMLRGDDHSILRTLYPPPPERLASVTRWALDQTWPALVKK